MKAENAVSCLEALANPTRLNIYRYLVSAGEDGSPVGDIQKRFDIPGSTLSHHISRMVRAELVYQERRSRVLICRANFGLMKQLIGYLTENCCAGENSCC